MKPPARTGRNLPPEPSTLKALYQQVTGDTASHQRRIDAQAKRLTERQRRLLKLRCEGQSYRTIGAAEGCTGGAAQDAVARALEHVRKAIAGEPRYNQTGR